MSRYEIPDDMPLDAEALYMREVRWLVKLTDVELASFVDCLVVGRLEQGKPCPDRCLLKLAREARNTLLERYQLLITTIAGRYIRYFKRLEFLDLVQECNVALLEALEEFPVEHSGFSFGYYLATSARYAVIHALRSLDGPMRLHWRKLAALKQLGQVESQLWTSLERPPTVVEVAREMQIEAVKVLELLELRQLVQMTSLQGLMRDELAEDRYHLTNFFALGSQTQTDERQRRAERVNAAIEQGLTPREQLVVHLRYGFEDGSLASCKQEAVASRLGVSRRRVGQLEQSIQRRLRPLLAPLCEAAS